MPLNKENKQTLHHEDYLKWISLFSNVYIECLKKQMTATSFHLERLMHKGSFFIFSYFYRFWYCYTFLVHWKALKPILKSRFHCHSKSEHAHCRCWVSWKKQKKKKNKKKKTTLLKNIRELFFFYLFYRLTNMLDPVIVFIYLFFYFNGFTFVLLMLKPNVSFYFSMQNGNSILIRIILLKPFIYFIF